MPSKTILMLLFIATLLTANRSQADVIVAMPDGSDITTSAIGLPQYTYEFAPIADATDAYFEPTGLSSASVQVITTESGAIVSGWWSVFLKLNDAWELQHSESIPYIVGFGTTTIDLNALFGSGNPMSFDQATLSGVRFEFDPNVYPGSDFVAEAAVANNTGIQQLVVTAVPEPISLALLGLGGLLYIRRRPDCR